MSVLPQYRYANTRDGHLCPGKFRHCAAPGRCITHCRIAQTRWTLAGVAIIMIAIGSIIAIWLP